MDDFEVSIKAAISDLLNVPLEKVENHKTFSKDLGADSLDTVSMLIGLEEEFDIEISDEDAKKIKTVQDAIDFSKRMVSLKKQSAH